MYLYDLQLVRVVFVLFGDIYFYHFVIKIILWLLIRQRHKKVNLFVTTTNIFLPKSFYFIKPKSLFMKMNKTAIKSAIFFLLGMSLSFIGKAQEPSLLYKIEGQGIQPSYLFGTIHVLPNKDFVMEDKVKEAFNETELLVLELDMDDPNMQAEMMSLAMMEGDNSIDKMLNESDYQKLDAALKSVAGVGLAPFNRMKPFLVASMLLSKYTGEQPASFEGTFVQMAMASKKEVLGLETPEEQLSIFDKISYQKQLDDIIEMLDDEEATKKLFEDMIQVYKSEDTEKMYSLFTEYYDSEDEEIDLMLHDRNKNWIPKIGKIGKENSTFFGVGAGHLGGEEGVVNLLKEAGYTVTPIED